MIKNIIGVLKAKYNLDILMVIYDHKDSKMVQYQSDKTFNIKKVNEI